MPLTAKGKEVMAALKKQYGDKKGEEVFYAMKNAGKLSGVDSGEAIEKELGELSGQMRAMKTRDKHIHLYIGKSNAGTMRTLARGTQDKAQDMQPNEFDQLRGLLSRFLKEESREPEHRTRDGKAKDCGCPATCDCKDCGKGTCDCDHGSKDAKPKPTKDRHIHIHLTPTRDARRVVAIMGSFAVFEKDGRFFVATRSYPSGGKLPSGSYAEPFNNEQEARAYMRELAADYR